MAPVKDAFAWRHHPRIPNHQQKICEDKTLTPLKITRGTGTWTPGKDIILGKPSIFRCTSEQKTSSSSQAPTNSPTSPSTLRAIWVSLYVHNLHEYPACWMRLQAPQVVEAGPKPLTKNPR